MQETLIIYDQTGYVLNTIDGWDLREPVGVPFLKIPKQHGKYVDRVDVSATPHVAVLKDMQKTETQLLQERVDLMQAALDEMILNGGAL